jgi:hypothetical protein
VVNHQGPIQQWLNQISQRLDKDVPQFKLHFVSSGSTVTEAGPNFRLNQVMQAAPSGALFRNAFLRG